MAKKFRRPAILTPAQTEQITGEEDPAQSSIVANEAARAFLDPTATDARSVDIRNRARTDGPDEFAPLWQGQPGSTAPGVLWRAYVMYQWWQSDPQTIRDHFATGKRTTFIQQLYGDLDMDADSFFADTKTILWAGQGVAFNEYLLTGAKFFYTVATGVAAAHPDTDATDQSADEIRDKAEALTAVADDFKDCLWRHMTGIN